MNLELTDSKPRLYALDNLRAIMMWLGVVIHVSVNYVVGQFPIPWRDSKQTIVADMLVAFIHSFRMPVFFIIAGFFVTMLLVRIGPLGMLKHRLRRLALPFVIFWPPIFIATVILMMLFVHLMVRGTIGLDPSVVPKPPSGVLISTLHLWFLYLLIWFCVLTALWSNVAGLVSIAIKDGLTKIVSVLSLSYWGSLILAIPLAFVGSYYQAGVFVVSGSFLPSFGEWVHHGLFFIVGIVLFHYQDQAFTTLMKRCWIYAVAGLFFYGTWIGLYEADLKRTAFLPLPNLLMAYVYNCSSWLFSFALIGWFLRYLPDQNRVLKYMANSSYWSYLVHMLGTIGFGVLLYHAPLGAVSKMAINMIATTVFCLVTYQMFVYRSYIGRLLNGRKFEAPSALS